jgi:hypothetical protein
MAWFRRKPSWEVSCAENFYYGLVAYNDIGGMTAVKLRLPPASHRAYADKALLQREMICLVALTNAATPNSLLQPVMGAFGTLVANKASRRGLQITGVQLAEHALRDFEQMTSEPYQWAQRWLTEFKDDPKEQLHGRIVRRTLLTAI